MLVSSFSQPRTALANRVSSLQEMEVCIAQAISNLPNSSNQRIFIPNPPTLRHKPSLLPRRTSLSRTTRSLNSRTFFILLTLTIESQRKLEASLPLIRFYQSVSVLTFCVRILSFVSISQHFVFGIYIFLNFIFSDKFLLNTHSAYMNFLQAQLWNSSFMTLYYSWLSVSLLSFA